MYKKFYLKTMLLLAMMLIGAGNAWATDVTVSMTSFTSISGNVGGDASISYEAAKGNAGTAPAVNDGEIRVYQNGGTFTVTANNGVKIKSITLGSSMSTTVTYSVDGGTASSNQPISANGTITVNNLECTSVLFTCTGTTRSTRLYVNQLSVTYETSAMATTTTIDASGITNTDVYNSTSAGSLSATVKDNNNEVLSGATVTWSSSNTDVATIASDGTITLVAAGTTTITASYAGDETYASSSSTYELTVTDSTPYVQPTSIEIIPNYTFWGKTGQFSGNDFSELSGTQDNVTLAWTKGSGSTYANTTAMRFYKDNTLTFTAPDGYEIKSIELEVSGTYDDLTFSPAGYDNETTTWTGSSATVTMSRPSNASSYATISKFTITIGAASTDPSIAADNVNITYDATSGAITYTVNNGVDGGVVTATTSDWLTLGTVGENVPFTCAANSSAVAREATVTLTYTYGDNQKTTKDVTVTQAGDPNATMTIAQVRAQGTGNVKTQGVVTSCVGTTAYIQDATAAICVYGQELTVGDEITVEGTLASYEGLLEITEPVFTVLSQDNTISPEVMTIADVLASDNQGWLVRIENATVQSLGQNTVVAQGEYTIVVHKISSEVEYEVGDILSLTGNIGYYNNKNQIANPTDVQVQETPRVEYYLAGNWTNGWDLSGMKKLTQNQDGTYSITMNDFSAGTEFKIVRKNLDNSLTWFGGQSDNNTYEIHNLWWKDIQMVQDNKNFTIPTSGNYTFTVNVTAMKLTVTGWTYTLKGSFDEWAAGETFTSQGNGVYTLTKELTAVTTFKIVDERNNYYSNGAFSKDNCTDLAIYTDNADMTIAEASEYVFTLTTDNNSIKLTVEGWPQFVEGDKFVKVTSTDALTSGQYLIVYEDANVAFDGSLETLDAASNTIGVNIVNDANDGNTIVANNDNVKSVFAIDTTAGSIKSASGLYIGKNSDANGLETSTEPYTNTISIDANGNADVVSEGGAYLRYNATSGQTRFRYFKSSTYTSQKAIQLYKLVHETTPEVTFSENAEDNSVIAANELLVVNATLERTLSNTYWSTFSVPFDVDADQVTAVLGEGVELRKFQGSEGTVIKFQEATAIEAGHAYLVKPAATVTNPVFNGVTVVNTIGEMDADDNDYGFVGAVIKTKLAIDKTELFLGTDAKFYYPESEAKATMKGLRGYFVVPAGTEPSKLSVDVEGSGIATSINSMNIEGMGDGNIYNLNGQRVNAPQKGLYIVNGKKVIIK